ncbi:MAG TPA: ATP-grasp domain-containing protein [Planctomycetota bacterium]
MTRRVLVTDARRSSALAFIRSLGRKGWHVIAADDDRRSPGFRSRYAAERFVYPAPGRSPSAFVASLHARLCAQPVDLLVPVTDACIQPLAHARRRFAGLAELAIAEDEALATVMDKSATLALGRALGVPVPETRSVGGLEEARAAAAELGYPLVLKPTVSRRYSMAEDRLDVGRVRFARDRAELERLLPPLLERHALLLQRYEAGTGVGLEALAHGGRVLHAFQHRRLAEIPPSGGASAWRESMALDPQLLGHATRLIEALRWSGLIMIEFKLGRQPWLVEINGRVWGSLPLACHAGLDFPGALAELYESPEATRVERAPYRVGVRTYDLELMLSWIVQVLLAPRRRAGPPLPARPRALAGLAGLLDPAQAWDLTDRDDVGPRRAELWRIARKLASKLRQVGRRA